MKKYVQQNTIKSTPLNKSSNFIFMLVALPPPEWSGNWFLKIHYGPETEIAPGHPVDDFGTRKLIAFAGRFHS